jgi:hypothetical protein
MRFLVPPYSILVMNRPSTPNVKSRFSGSLRHYHRSSSQEQRTWEEWVDGKSSRSWISKNWIKITVITLAVLALGGIVTGLVIELQ